MLAYKRPFIPVNLHEIYSGYDPGKPQMLMEMSHHIYTSHSKSPGT